MTVGELTLLVVPAVPVVIGAGALLRQRPQRGVLVLAGLLPFNGLLLIIPHPGLVDGWKEGLTVLVLGATFVAPATARGADGRQLPSWLLPAAGWLLLSLVSAAVVGGYQGLEGVKIGFFYVLLFWAMWRCPLDACERDRLVTILMGVGVVTAAWGILQQVVGADALVSMGYEWDTTVRTNGGFLRAFSTFVQPFGFGLFVMVVLLVGLAVALADPRRLRNALFLAATPILLGGLLSSTVRSAALGLFAGLVVLAVLRHRGFLHAVPLALIGVAAVPSSVLAAFLSSSSFTDRTTGWNQMVSTILRSPFGIGIGSTGSAAEKATAEGGSAEHVLTTSQWSEGYQPDNYYMKTLLELGPLGLWMVVLLLLATLTAGWSLARALPADGVDAALARGITATIAAATVASFAATYFEISPLDALFWMFLGLLATMPGQQADPRAADTARERAAVAGAGT